MKLSQIVVLFLIIPNILSEDYYDILYNLETLEKYMYCCVSQQKLVYKYILQFIRSKKYITWEWTIVAGNLPEYIYDCIKYKDETYHTNTLALREYEDIELPSKIKLDFVHLFAVMNGMDNLSISTTLVGWGGDLATLAEDLKNNFGYITDLNQLIIEARKFLGIKGQFGEGDLTSDLSAPIMLRIKYKTGKTFANIMRDLFESEDFKFRIKEFVEITFPYLKDKTKIRQFVEMTYNSDLFIPVLECKHGIRTGTAKCLLYGDIIPQYENHRRAAIYAFADFLGENI